MASLKKSTLGLPTYFFAFLALVVSGMANSAAAVENLPDSFYERTGLEEMPRIDYASMPVVNVKDLGALGDGEQIANPYFERAVEALQSQGGGVLFIPKGTYHFEMDESNPASMIRAYGKSKPGNIWHPGGGEGLENIHFVGEGMESVLEFEFTKTLPHYAFHSNAMMITGGKNISLRDLAITQTPFNRQRRGGDVKTGNSFRTAKTDQIQLINVYVDQGDLGLGFFFSKNIWVVDCDIRNTRADNVKVDNCDEATVAYNYMEEPMDDNTSMIYYKQHRDTPSHGYRFLQNTLIGPGFGRGFIMAGESIRVEGNWIERTYGNGIASYGLLRDYTVIDNTLVRSGLAARSGNPRPYHSESHYSSALKLTGGPAAVAGNRIYGPGGMGLRMKGMEGASMEGNRVELSEAEGLVFLKGETPDEVAFSSIFFEGNTFVQNAKPILLGGKFEDSVVLGNLVSQAPIDEGSGEEIAAGFVVEDLDPEYFDVYAFAREETAYTDFDAPTSTDILERIGEEFVDVRDYGALGDGVHNDTEAFQTALAALPEAGGTLFVPEGIYRIAPMEEYATFPFTKIRQHIRIAGRNNIRIQGEGPGSKLIFESLDHQGLRFIGCENVAVQSLMLTTDETAPLRRNRALLDFSGCRGVLAQYVSTEGGEGPAIQLDNVNEGLVVDCLIEGSGQYGIRLQGACQISLSRNEIRETRDSAIHIDSYGSIIRDSDYVTVSENRILGTLEGAGLVVISGKVQLLDNEIEDTYLSGVYVYQPGMGWAMNELTVRGNRIVDCGQHIAHSGILFGTPLRRGDRGRVLIEGNEFTDLRHNGVHVAFGRSMIWGPQGFYSFTVRDNTFENIGGTECLIELQSHSEGKDDDIQISHLDVDSPSL
ncbi:right-handed parallel beta-helix repeat-containing protein [Puniceicoccus vermicola]|uniref:Right-handed parallel beta-helix repeat-containing protein n=1 Tax=Puniceicoccus vermicola TaxID=388746 RepID=A0A7X1B2M8_9BACT|nr:right-handed parallel beta-helix repeat-containing protein [Puniceicoccus vermicola]MBC2604422.1 right-handed parallel beta-helix repeat-containing protein [Puniceicoccus vermicola]